MLSGAFHDSIHQRFQFLLIPQGTMRGRDYLWLYSGAVVFVTDMNKIDSFEVLATGKLRFPNGMAAIRTTGAVLVHDHFSLHAFASLYR